MRRLFWLSDRQWELIMPHLPYRAAGRRREDDRRIISGIIHVLQSGCRWRDCPPEYGPPTTIYNRYNRWSQKGHWQYLFAALTERLAGAPDQVSIDSTHVKAVLDTAATGRTQDCTRPSRQPVKKSLQRGSHPHRTFSDNLGNDRCWPIPDVVRFC